MYLKLLKSSNLECSSKLFKTNVTFLQHKIKAEIILIKTSKQNIKAPEDHKTSFFLSNTNKKNYNYHFMFTDVLKSPLNSSFVYSLWISYLLYWCKVKFILFFFSFRIVMEMNGIAVIFSKSMQQERLST